MKRYPHLASASIAAIASTLLCSTSISAERSTSNDPVNVIFETDIWPDIDDPMALAMLHTLQDRREMNLIAVVVSVEDKWIVPYVDLINTFYGHPDIPIGIIQNGLSSDDLLKMRSTQVRPKLNWTQTLSERTKSDGSFVYPHRILDASKAPEAVSLLRKTLVQQPDNSVVMIQVGYSTNYARLLESHPDEVSPLSGRNLIKKKVRFLSVMAGSFSDSEWQGKIIRKGIGVNIYEDIASAQKLFSGWPTPIVASGGEIGSRMVIPAVSIADDFSYVSDHPIAETYRSRSVESPQFTEKWPHDHHTLDLTAVLYAIRSDRNYFSLSKPGKITVLPDGAVRFEEDDRGSHHYLILDEGQKNRAQEAMIMLVSQPPVCLKHHPKTISLSSLSQ